MSDFNNPGFRPVIESLLDTDLYKFTMWQPFLHHFPGNEAAYRFVCRNTPAFELGELAREVREQIAHLCTLRFEEDELTYLASKRYFKKDFIDFLRLFHFQERYVRVENQEGGLFVEVRGPQIHVMGFEIHVLSIVNELYFRRLTALSSQDSGGQAPAFMEKVRLEGERRLAEKIALITDRDEDLMNLIRPKNHPFEIFDFGTRRRFSREWQDYVVRTLAESLPRSFKGTSNVYLARKYNLAAIGTMAHEYLQTYQAVGVQLKYFQKAALEGWVQEYRGDLGVALTDVVGMDAFLKDFDLYFAKLFDGLRHDSGDPVEWGEKALAHYRQLGVNPGTKRLVFSDGLNVTTALDLYDHFANDIACGFGIGTHFTNDLGPDCKPLNIVMKLVECNGQPVAKLSDAPGKTLCEDGTFLSYLRQVFAVQAV